MSRLSVETEYDKAITALATSLATCSMSKCRGTKCATCPTKQQQDNVYNSMADLDKLRVQNELAVMLARLNPPKSDLRHATLLGIWDCRGTIIGLLLFLFLIFGLPFLLQASTPDDVKYILKQTTWNVFDVNCDAKLNCVDYAITFKKQWDKRYNQSDCEIVRNLSPSLNHLFVRVKVNGSWVCIEPSAYFYGYINSYTMKEFWEDKYDSRYNFYNETEYWMSYDKSNW